MLFLVLLAALFAAPRPFRVYISLEPHDNVELPPDFMEKTEWVFARLMYPPHPQAKFTRRRFFGTPDLDWRQGGTSWTQDYPRADRHFSQILRRLTRLHVRSVEQPVNLDDDEDVFEYPFLTAGEMGDWLLTDAQCVKLRDYLLRGGFLFLDDFWGTEEWDRFMQTMSRVLPDRPILEIPDHDAIFHTLYDLNERWQIPGMWAIRRGSTYRSDGAVPHWRGIYDDKGRIMVAIAFNHDVGDAWEWADEPGYPEKYSALGIRMGVNYVLYALTH
ncbi:MAG: DUF4159 domain-containing protein [Bryobacteraceae bacterium]|nr:DUF4159 domain-containing protein [Bryobacteraceae bacterium]